MNFHLFLLLYFEIRTWLIKLMSKKNFFFTCVIGILQFKKKRNSKRVVRLICKIELTKFISYIIKEGK